MGNKNKPPVSTPSWTPTYCTVAAVVRGKNGNPISGITATLFGCGYSSAGFTNKDGYCKFDGVPSNNPSSDYAVLTLKLDAPGYIPYEGVYKIDSNTDIPVELYESKVPIPKYTRDEIINVQCNLCSLRDSDDIPIFEPFIDYLIIHDEDKAVDWVNRLKAAGSTHINLDICGDYDENLGWNTGWDNNRYPVPGTDWYSDLDTFKEILDWVLSYDLIPIIHFGVDGQGYDPHGMTKGWQWGMDNLPQYLPLLSDYVESALFLPTYDGGFPDWTPDQTASMYAMLRNVLGVKANLAIEMGGPAGSSVSYCHMGKGSTDWDINGGLKEVDVYLLELQVDPSQLAVMEPGIAETATRMLGPDARMTPTSPYYIPPSANRGRRVAVFYETGTYWFIRKQFNDNAYNKVNILGKKYGFTLFGSGLSV